MKFYKVIDGQNFLGIGTTEDLKYYLKKNYALIISTENTAQYIQIGDELYHAGWMKKTDDDVPAKLVSVVEITQEEYNDIFSALDSGDDIEVVPEQDKNPPVEEEPQEQTEAVTVEYVKELKLAEISKACNRTIVNGLDIELSDGKTHHFSLTEQDQSNLIALSLSVAKGETSIPYHADDELCVFYSVADINTIVNNATAYITYHTTYHNSLKAYVKSLRSVNTISKVAYGMDIPEKYQSEVLVALLANQQ